MNTIHRAHTEYEYVLQALNEGAGIQEIKDELSRWEREEAYFATDNTQAVSGAAY